MTGDLTVNNISLKDSKVPSTHADKGTMGSDV